MNFKRSLKAHQKLRGKRVTKVMGRDDNGKERLDSGKSRGSSTERVDSGSGS